MPSDVKGFWVSKVTKNKYQNKREKEKSFDDVANEISDIFIKDINKTKQPNKDKLQYLVHWDEYKHEIYNYNGYSQISEKLLYGMQSAIYLNETDQLISHLNQIKSNSSQVRKIINCVCSMLSVFIKTNRLTRNLSKRDYNELIDSLNYEYELSIDDNELKSWCTILRKDKLQLCYELGAESFDNSKKYFEKSLNQGLEVIDLIKQQVDQKPADEYYALLYLAFQYRNLAELYHRLHDISPNEYSLDSEIKYRELSYNTRNKLRQYYKQTYGEDILFDNFLQEYILSLIEFYPFVSDDDLRENIVNSVQSLVEKWKEQIERKNFIFNEINDKATSFMNLGEN